MHDNLSIIIIKDQKITIWCFGVLWFYWKKFSWLLGFVMLILSYLFILSLRY